MLPLLFACTPIFACTPKGDGRDSRFGKAGLMRSGHSANTDRPCQLVANFQNLQLQVGIGAIFGQEVVDSFQGRGGARWLSTKLASQFVTKNILRSRFICGSASRAGLR